MKSNLHKLIRESSLLMAVGVALRRAPTLDQTVDISSRTFPREKAQVDWGTMSDPRISREDVTESTPSSCSILESVLSEADRCTCIVQQESISLPLPATPQRPLASGKFQLHKGTLGLQLRSENVCASMQHLPRQSTPLASATSAPISTGRLRSKLQEEDLNSVSPRVHEHHCTCTPCPKHPCC